MNAERLLAHYDRIADAPDAVERLRRFILDLAIRGKLLAQNPSDAPASELLKLIAKEKARLANNGAIRTSKAIPDLSETPFRIPANWHWSQLAEIGVLSPRNDAPDTLQASFVPMPLIAAQYGVPNKHEACPWCEIKKGYTHFAEGDVGLAKITPCFENGKSTVFRGLTGGIGSGTTELHIVRPILADPDYILLFLKSPHFIESGIPKMTGTAGQKRVPTEYFAHSPFPCPPLAEQHRIVAKVDELMALCDRLEAARAERETKRDRLTISSLARLNAPDSETFQADVRFVLNALPALTMRPDQIKQIRQTILNLAVRGKLVPQDPRDEPANAAVEKVRMEAKQAIRAGVIRRFGPKGPIACSDLPDLPPGWQYSRLSEVVRPAPHAIKRGPFGSAIRKDMFVGSGFKVYEQQHAISGDFKKGHYYITPLKFQELSAFELHAKEVLVSCSGTVGKVAIVPDGIEPGIINQALLKLSLHQCALLNEYFLVLFPAFFMHTDTLADLQGTAQKNIPGMDVLREMPFPLPPLVEQHRIVAKVDELMALCDQLEAGLTDTADTRRRLLDALLTEALASAA